MSRSTRFHDAALAGLAAIALVLSIDGFGSVAAAQNPPSEGARKPVEPKKPDYSPYPDQKFSKPRLLGRCPRSHGLLLRLGNVRGHDDPRRPLQGGHGEGKSSSTTASASSRTGRWTGSPSPTMPSTWASPIRFAKAAPSSSPTHKASAGTKCRRRALRKESKPPSKRSFPCRPASLCSTPARSRPRPGRTPRRPPRSGTNRVSSPRCTASSGPARLAATTFIAPSSSATARTA